MQIAHLGPSVLPIRFHLGGAIQRRMLELSRCQAELGHKVTIYSADQRPGVETWHGVDIRNIVCHRRVLALRDWEYLKRAAQVIAREPVDVLHFHSLPEASVIMAKIPAAKLLSYDNFIFRRGKQTPLYWAYRRALRKFDCLLPVSEYCCRESLHYWKLKSSSASVVHNGVNLGQFFPDPAAGKGCRQELGLEGKRVILYVGRVCKQKGTDILIESYRRIKDRVRDAALVVAGPAEQFENSAASALTREIEAVGGRYLGAVPEHRIAAVFNMCDVFVMPTRELEMFGMATIEAQACGKPVIASLQGGLPEVVSEAGGLFFPVGNAAALAEQLESILTNSALLSMKARAARESVERFAWPKIVRRLEEIYETFRAPRAAPESVPVCV